MVAGVLAFACYGVVVNVVPWNFSRLMCAYNAVFALITLSWRQFVLGQELPKVIWLGVAIVVSGGLVVLLGESL
jgi:drug/metabolite transporter superfamily protein YnfA